MSRSEDAKGKRRRHSPDEARVRAGAGGGEQQNRMMYPGGKRPLAQPGESGETLEFSSAFSDTSCSASSHLG